jgi:hypothetical protein
MKYCPTCQTRYDEEVLRFCMKDGTPLVEEGEPKFVQMPSESLAADDDPGEVTIIRKKGEIPIPPPEMDESGELKPPDPEYRPQEPVFRPKEEAPARFVIPTEESRPHARVIPPYQPPPKSHTFRTVVLTILGTLTLLAIGAFGFWLVAIRPGNGANSNANNANANANVNLNTNLGFDANFNFNSSGSYNNSTVNVNANSKTPTPTPRPSPSGTPTASPTPDEDETPTPTPRPSPSVPSMQPMNRPSSTPPRMMPTNRPANRPSNTQ